MKLPAARILVAQMALGLPAGHAAAPGFRLEDATLANVRAAGAADDKSQVFSASSGFPATKAARGYSVSGRLPAGITFFGRAWDAPTLITRPYSYEQSTKHRRPPQSTPPLVTP